MYARFVCSFLVIIELIALDIAEYQINYLEVMRDYYLLCGPQYFCYKANETYKWDITTDYSYNDLRVCPECHCDKECIRRGDCCPDVFFRFPELKCVNRTIIKANDDTDREEQASSLMVVSCPTESDKELRDKCQNLNDTKSKLLNSPVTGKAVPLTFFNKYCAACHNVTDFKFWTLDINCSRFADFNYLSSLDGVIEMAKDRSCIFQAIHPDSDAVEDEGCFNIEESKTVYTKCNETGNWRQFSQSIKSACESEYRLLFRTFKNVFCYMCNPPSRPAIASDIISSCNLTGQWKMYDQGLETSCSELPNSPTTTPYKNIFCYLCNRGNNHSNRFVDMVGEIEEFVLRDSYFRFEYDLQVDTFNMEYFKHILTGYIQKDYMLQKPVYHHFSKTTINTANDSVVNLTNLLTQEASLSPSGVRVCPARLSLFPEDYSKDCDCKIVCIFQRRSRCCADLEIELPTTCRDELELSNIESFRRIREGYLVINGCFQERTIGLLKEGCFRRKFEDLFSILPITSSESIPYNNLYCVLCNLESDDYIRILNDISKRENKTLLSDEPTDLKEYLSKMIETYKQKNRSYDIWDLEIICPTYLDYTYLVTTADIINTAWDLKCRVRYKTESEGPSSFCTQRGEDHTRCFQFRNWTYSDKDIEWACNNVIPYTQFNGVYFGNSIPSSFDRAPEKIYRQFNFVYENVFYALCKPTINFTTNFVSNCSASVDKSVESYCEEFPRIYYYYPFKNYHCARCNGMYAGMSGPSAGRSVIPFYGRIGDVGWYPILRNIFSISQDEPIRIQMNRAEQCAQDQVFDETTRSCRNITCYSGKYLLGSACHPLLTLTKNLRYLLDFKAEIIWTHSWIKDAEFHVLVEVQRELLLYLNASETVFNRVFVRRLDTRCRGEPESACMYFKLDLFIQSTVARLEVEIALVQFRSKTIVSSGNISVIQLSRYDEQTTDMPKGDGLNITSAEPRATYVADYYMSRVSEVLLCRQIELEEDEFNRTENNSSLILLKLGVKVPVHKYDLTPSGNVRICYDYLMTIGYFASPKQRIPSSDIRYKYLWVISLICTIVSMLCLALSIAVYCLLPSLRTTPGKLLMFMMTSLLFTLLFLNTSPFIVESYTACVLVGMISHFCWLSVFTSMNACNFHTFRTFVINKRHTSTPIRFCDSAISKNVVYVMGVPLLLIGINVLVSRFIYPRLTIGYGGSKCFMDNNVSVIAMFIIPVALICLSNVFFLLLTLRAIHVTPNPGSNQRERNELIIFFRLASITGISWLLQIIDSFLPLTPFTFVATIINSLQGLFIFLAFVMNKRIVGLLRQLQIGRTTSTAASKTGSSHSTESSKI